MKLGILVNKSRHLPHIMELTMAAIAKQHEVQFFIMDEGTQLLQNDQFLSLAEQTGVSMRYCAHSAKMLNVSTEKATEKIQGGSQLDNAMMMHDTDKVIVL